MEASAFNEKMSNDLTTSLGLMMLYTGFKLDIFAKMNYLQNLKKNSSITKLRKEGEPDGKGSADQSQHLKSEDDDVNSYGLNVKEVAKCCELHERYVKEFLEACVTHGFILYQAPSKDDEALFYLPRGHTECLVEGNSPFYCAPKLAYLPALAGALKEDKLFKAFRTGTGVDYSIYGEEVLEAINEGSRPLIIHELVNKWLASMPDVVELLKSKETIIGDVGCGQGLSTIEIAKHFPLATIYGFDLDARVIEKAIESLNEQDADVKTRVNFLCKAAQDVSCGDVTDDKDSLADSFDLIILIKCLHDMTDPLVVLTTLRPLLKPNGVIFIGDMRVAEEFCDMIPGKGNAMDVNMGKTRYAFNILHCLPAAMSESGNAIGAATTSSIITRIANDAGFRTCKIVHETKSVRFYRLEVQ